MVPVSQQIAMQAAAGATGNGTAIITADAAALVMQIAGTFVGTVSFEANIDNTNWVAIQAVNLGDGSVATTATASGLFGCIVAGLYAVRARVSAWTSGTITVTGLATTAPSDLPMSGAVSLAILGVTSGAAVVTDANGTLQQYLRCLV